MSLQPTVYFTIRVLNNKKNLPVLFYRNYFYKIITEDYKINEVNETNRICVPNLKAQLSLESYKI